MLNAKAVLIAAMISALASLSACSTERIVDNTVDATGFVAKTAVKGTVGAGRLAVKGAKKVSGAD
ncbi:hypothetical protein ACFSUD_04405 [Sulfitobacter aestuarii]|uniref:Entericidin EcnA/B family protein n=1 Tax=Sulfitobacter aestuarii TaxID=2161676 RepID=A0ABW5U0X9_9RHOB